MNKVNPWASEFGRTYTDRNDLRPLEADKLYYENYGVTRTQLNEEFLSGLPLSTSMLEVGCNLGVQLQLLKKHGYERLNGIDISFYALSLLRSRLYDVNLLRSSAICIPFKTNSFDLVYSSGVLIHINPRELNTVLDEIYRCSKRYVWCFEYYADEETEVEYRDKKGLMWKTDFLRKFTERFNDLSIIKEKKLKYRTNENIDIMFLLEKSNTHS